MARKNKRAGAAPLSYPESRSERYLANIAGILDDKPAAPFTREERYLDAISSRISDLSARPTFTITAGEYNLQIGFGTATSATDMLIPITTPPLAKIPHFDADEIAELMIGKTVPVVKGNATLSAYFCDPASGYGMLYLTGLTGLDTGATYRVVVAAGKTLTFDASYTE